MSSDYVYLCHYSFPAFTWWITKDPCILLIPRDSSAFSSTVWWYATPTCLEMEKYSKLVLKLYKNSKNFITFFLEQKIACICIPFVKNSLLRISGNPSKFYRSEKVFRKSSRISGINMHVGQTILSEYSEIPVATKNLTERIFTCIM